MRDADIALSWIHYLEDTMDQVEREYERTRDEKARLERLCSERCSMKNERAIELFKESKTFVGDDAWYEILNHAPAELTHDAVSEIVKRGKTTRQLQRAMRYFDRLFPDYRARKTEARINGLTNRLNELYDKLVNAELCYDRCRGKTSTSLFALCVCEDCSRKTCTSDSTPSPHPKTL